MASDEDAGPKAFFNPDLGCATPSPRMDNKNAKAITKITTRIKFLNLEFKNVTFRCC